MSRRTLKNCSLIKKHGDLDPWTGKVTTPDQYDGLCEGFQKSEMDDEPCETCKKCPLCMYGDER